MGLFGSDADIGIDLGTASVLVYINGKGPFYEVPYCCGDCKCGINSNMREAGGLTHCSLFGLTKRYYDTPPKRCRDMFEKALAIGGEVVLVAKN